MRVKTFVLQRLSMRDVAPEKMSFVMAGEDNKAAALAYPKNNDVTL
jgi:hypothetical protein